MTTPETAPVIDDDRIAYLALNHLPSKYRADIMAGEWDNVTGMQVLARHRLAAVRDLEAERVKLWNEKRDFEGSLVVQKAATDELKAQLAEALGLLARIRTETIGSKVAGGDGQTYIVVPLSGDTLNAISAFLSRTGGEDE